MVAEKMGPSQAPVCEAFIMTGDTILKTYTNKSETGGPLKPAAGNKNTLREPDSTTPDLKACISTGAQLTSRDALTSSKSECTNSQQSKNINSTTNNNNNNNNTQDYIKHAQYRVAAALEQRRKSLSMSKLNEVNHANAGAGDSSFLFGLNRRPTREDPGEGGVGGTNRWRESIREEASVSASPRTLLEQQRLHEQTATQQQQQQQQQLHNRPQEQPQLQQRQQARQLQQGQQKPLHEYTDRPNSQQQSTPKAPKTIVESQLSNSDTNKQPKDCENSIGHQAESVKKQHRAQQRKQRLQQQMDQHPTPVARTATFIVTSRRDLSKLNGVQRSENDNYSIEFKTGFLNRKRTFEARAKATSKGQRGWSRVYVILRDLRFIMRYGQQENKQLERNEKDMDGANATDPITRKMEEQSAKTRKQLAAKDLKNTIRLHHAFAKRSTTYTKREYVFHLYLADQSEFLLQASSESEMNSWIDTINFASACLSSAPLQSAVSSSSRRYCQSSKSRLILPASYTKHSYWEQLTDHEERLERLKAELEEHLNEAPVKRKASKSIKSEFIDKIAHLRHMIERYTVYLDLMQKKSNSPEAIVLSKHPQIASLTPSKEMVRSLPLNAKAHEDEDKKSTN